MKNPEFDFVIIGSGLGGLSCAYMLASEGYKVCILEKNHQIGGALQVFSRDKAVLDTGVHYIGSLDKGETLDQIFRYFGILEDLKLKRMDEDGFDVIRFEDGSVFPYAQGYDHFRTSLVGQFPDEAAAIDQYIATIRKICEDFPLYNLDENDYDGEVYPHMEVPASEFINSLTTNERLRSVLAGTNSFLYAGVAGITPLHVHALVQNSYLKGAYRLIDGGSQLAILLSRRIREKGGVILKRSEVVKAAYHENGEISAVLLASGEAITGKQFISNIHPLGTIGIFGEDRFLKVFTRRIKSLENSLSCFLTHIIFHEKAFGYLNHNIYQYHNENVWSGPEYNEDTWPEQYFICTPAGSRHPQYAESMSVMAYMRAEETAEWNTTFNTRTTPAERSKSYEEFKKAKEQKVINRLEQVFPGIRGKIKSVYSSTPLTWRDYLGTPDGSMYGIMKKADNPLKSFVNTKTHIPNLSLTGQNIILHGILGVTIGAIVSCAPFIGRENIIRKIKQANKTT